MTLCTFATLEPSPAPEETLATLARVLGGRHVGAAQRILATDDSRSPDEGLALLEAYVGIAEKDTRQAILDVICAIAETDPYRRARARSGKTSPAGAAADAPIAPKTDDRSA